MRKKGLPWSLAVSKPGVGEVMGKSMELKHFTLVVTSCPNISIRTYHHQNSQSPLSVINCDYILTPSSGVLTSC